MKNEMIPAVSEQENEVTFVMPDIESLGKLKNMNQGFDLTIRYRKAEDWAALKNQEVRAYYMGLRNVTNKDGESVCCAVFVTDKECFIAAQYTLVEMVKNLPPKTALSITYRERKTNRGDSSRSTCIFDVAILE